MKAVTRKRHMERKIVERLLLGGGVNEIARELHVSKHRVMEVRERAREAGYMAGTKALPPYPEAVFEDTTDGRSGRGSEVWSLLEPHLAWMRERLEAGWHAVTVYEELPVRVPRSNFYRYLKAHELNEAGRRARLRVVPEIVHAPGEALLLDWGYLWMVDIEGRRRKLWAFVAVLGYSRYMVVRLMVECDLMHTLSELQGIYQTLGGVARRTTTDNPKIFATTASKYEPILNPVFERFASHYGTIIECLAPKTPEHKGKVERPMPYVRRLLEAYTGDKNDIEEIQVYLDKKVQIANERQHGTTHERPIDMYLNEEKQALRSLPIFPYEIEQYHEGTVRSDGHVRFDGKYYSVDERYIRKDVTIIGNATLVSIYHDGKLIETHERVTKRGVSKSTKKHHLKPWEQACDNPDGLEKLGAAVGPAVQDTVRSILAKGDGFIDFRRIWGILSLNKKYTNQEVNEACAAALAAEAPSYQTILKLLQDNKARQLESATSCSPTPRPAGKFQRDISEYTQMLLNLKHGESYEH